MKSLVILAFALMSQMSFAIPFGETFVDVYNAVQSQASFKALVKILDEHHSISGISITKFDRFEASDSDTICPANLNPEVVSRSATVIKVEIDYLTSELMQETETTYYVTEEKAKDVKQCSIQLIHPVDSMGIF